MVFREVSVIEVRQALRAWLAGKSERAVAAQAGVDRKTGKRYVTAAVIGPCAKRQYVSHVYYDHTSVLAMIERKCNLPALTLRDANANDLTDFIDLKALANKRPTFPSLPRLAAPGNTPAALTCSTTGAGTIPPPGSISG